MKLHRWKQQSGIGHLGLILALLAVLAVGAAGWWVFVKNKDSKSNVSQSVREAIKNANCTYDDKDLCKFFTGWKAQENFTLTATSKVDDKTSTTVMQNDGKNKYYLKIDGGGLNYEVIGIDNITYTKAADGTWWKQTVPQEDFDKYRGDAATEFVEPGAEGSKITYKNAGKEKCGELNCHKYEVLDADNPDTTTYLWFDDKDYQLRRMQTTTKGETFDGVFSYDKVSISEPSPVKELGAGQYLLPGQSEPTTLPDTGDLPTQEELEQLLRQYQ